MNTNIKQPLGICLENRNPGMSRPQPAFHRVLNAFRLAEHTRDFTNNQRRGHGHVPTRCLGSLEILERPEALQDYQQLKFFSVGFPEFPGYWKWQVLGRPRGLYYTVSLRAIVKLNFDLTDTRSMCVYIIFYIIYIYIYAWVSLEIGDPIKDDL